MKEGTVAEYLQYCRGLFYSFHPKNFYDLEFLYGLRTFWVGLMWNVNRVFVVGPTNRNI